MKRFLCISLVLIMIFSLVGCKNENKLQEAPNGVKISNYKNLEVVQKEYVVTEEFLDAMLDDIAKNFTSTEKIYEGPIEKYTIVNIDITSHVGEVLLEEASLKDCTFTLGDDKFHKDINTAIENAKVGDSIKVEITYAIGDTYSILDGKTVVHDIKINYIEKIIYPELTDELIQLYVKKSVVKQEQECKTVAEYREYLRNRYTFVYNKISRDELVDNILTQLLEKSEIPPVNTADLDAYVQNKHQYYIQYCENNGFTFESYLLNEKITEDEFKAQLRVDGELILKKTMLVNAIKDLEKITLTDEYYTKYLQYLAAYYQFESVEELEQSIGELNVENTIKGDALYDAVYEYLVTNQKITIEKVNLHDLVNKEVE